MIADDTTRHDPMSDDEKKKKDESGRETFVYFVDRQQFKAERPSISGAQIKASIPGYNPAFQLFLEGKGGEADRIINDADLVPLDHGAPHLYTAPPATFGGGRWQR